MLAPQQFRVTPTQRTYTHLRCGGGTIVGGGDFSHICNPFRTCTGTFCATCGDFFPLDEVNWSDTGENINDYRNRLAKATPGVVKAWRYGGGALAGALLGVILGALFHMFLMPPPKIALSRVIAGGAAIGTLVVYFLGIPVLNQIYGIDYRRMR